MDRIVYLLGAGFSAPLGLPLTGNFLTKSKEMCARDREKYSYFAEVFKTIKDLSIIKNYFEADLFNIEEILSILEMEEHLEGRKLNETLIKYIVDVIKYYTPEIEPHAPSKGLPGNWNDWLFGVNEQWGHYGLFIASLLNLEFKRLESFRGNPRDVMVGFYSKPQARYSIVTLNYDLIPENVCGFVNRTYSVRSPVSFIDTISAEDELPSYDGHYAPSLAKLHGSVDKGVIVPPTWNKGSAPDIVPSWKLAYHLLTKANHIRILGYSLPTADSYVKYLLKSAVISNEHLKRIDVICLDSDGSVQRRYDEFIKFNYYTFLSADTANYLSRIQLNKIEDVHYSFMKSMPK